MELEYTVNDVSQENDFQSENTIMTPTKSSPENRITPKKDSGIFYPTKNIDEMFSKYCDLN